MYNCIFMIYYWWIIIVYCMYERVSCTYESMLSDVQMFQCIIYFLYKIYLYLLFIWYIIWLYILYERFKVIWLRISISWNIQYMYIQMALQLARLLSAYCTLLQLQARLMELFTSRDTSCVPRESFVWKASRRYFYQKHSIWNKTVNASQ